MKKKWLRKGNHYVILKLLIYAIATTIASFGWLRLKNLEMGEIRIGSWIATSPEREFIMKCITIGLHPSAMPTRSFIDVYVRINGTNRLFFFGGCYQVVVIEHTHYTYLFRRKDEKRTQNKHGEYTGAIQLNSILCIIKRAMNDKIYYVWIYLYNNKLFNVPIGLAHLHRIVGWPNNV